MVKKVKKYEVGGTVSRDPEEIVADIERRQNKEDLELPMRVGRAMVSRLKDAANVGPMAAKAVGSAFKKSASERKINTGENTNPAGDTYKKGGKVSSASKRADGCATKGKTKGRFV